MFKFRNRYRLEGKPFIGNKFVQTLILAGVVILLPFILPYAGLATEVIIFAIALVAFDLLIGYTGMLTWCQGVFFGGGTYALGLMLVHYDVNVLLALLIAISAGMFLGMVLGFLSIQRKETYSVLITYALTEVVYFLAFHFKGVTGGDDGMVVPRPNIELGLFTIDISQPLAFYSLVAFLFILSFVLITRIVHSPFGRVLRGIRENESRAQSIGYNTKQFKLAAFVLSGMFTGLAGGLYGLFLKFAHISNVSFDTSARIVMMSLSGGIGTLFGPIVGAGFITILSELMSAIWPRWMMLLGLIFLTFVLYMRGGIWGVVTYVYDKLTRKKTNAES